MKVSNSKQCRQPLTTAEIVELDSALMGVFRAVHGLREGNPVARFIKFPSLPSIFSESIVIAATPALFGTGWAGRYGGRAADVIIENNTHGRALRVEVKATGQHAFQEIKQKDLLADALVWVRFGRRYELGAGPIEVVILESPGKHIKNPCRLDTRRFEAIPGVTRDLKVFRFDSLEAALAGQDG
jgi:hypothetical protein